MMSKKIIILMLVTVTNIMFSQTLLITGPKTIINHNDLTFYLDSDTNTYVSVHKITNKKIKNLNGVRKDKWHNEKPFGPYKRNYYVNTGYDLGHLTPCKITMYDDSTNYNSFSMFNQAPQLAYFNEHPWEHLEMSIIDTIINNNSDAIIITGVIYDNHRKTYLSNSRIKIPLFYYKILVLSNGKIMSWLGSNINGLITVTDVNNIIKIANMNGNNLAIQIIK